MGDLIFDIAEWLRGTFLVDFALWISDTSASQIMVENFWAIPIVQVIHILAISAAFGAALMFSLRILGKAGTTLTIEQSAARYVPWLKWSGVVLLVSGILMIIGEPLRELLNAIFWFKMILILGLIAGQLALQRSVLRQAHGAGTAFVASSGTRVLTVALLLLWCLIMFAGRWIAYAPA